MILAKDPPKVKLGTIHNSRVPEKLGQIVHTLVCEYFGVFIVV